MPTHGSRGGRATNKLEGGGGATKKAPTKGHFNKVIGALVKVKGAIFLCTKGHFWGTSKLGRGCAHQAGIQ